MEIHRISREQMWLRYFQDYNSVSAELQEVGAFVNIRTKKAGAIVYTKLWTWSYSFVAIGQIAS